MKKPTVAEITQEARWCIVAVGKLYDDEVADIAALKVRYLERRRSKVREASALAELADQMIADGLESAPK
ncbi:MAG: hypothetical protein WC645_07950 [Candidatus Margulisiibacteriota bacterium]